MRISDACGKLRIISRRLLSFLMHERMSHAGKENINLVASFNQLAEYGLTGRKMPAAINQCERLGFIEARRGGYIANADKNFAVYFNLFAPP